MDNRAQAKPPVTVYIVCWTDAPGHRLHPPGHNAHVCFNRAEADSRESEVARIHGPENVWTEEWEAKR